MTAYVHRRTFRVVMSEVDVAQIHFTNAFRWMDRGLSEWLAEIGHPFTSILETGPGIPIVDARCSFLGRIMLDDVIDQATEIGGIGRTDISIRGRNLDLAGAGAGPVVALVETATKTLAGAGQLRARGVRLVHP